MKLHNTRFVWLKAIWMGHRLQAILSTVIISFLFCFNSFGGPASSDSLAKHYLEVYDNYLYGGFYKSINYKEVIPIGANYSKIRNPELKAETAFLLGQLHIFLYDMVAASNFFEQSCEQYLKLHDWKQYLMVAQKLSLSYRASAKTEKVLPLLKRCLQISREHDTGIYVLGIYHEMVLLNTYNLENPKIGIDYGQKFVDTLAALNSKAIKNRYYTQINTYIKNTVFLEMGRCYLELDEFDKSDKYLKDAEVYFLEIGEFNKVARVYESFLELNIRRKHEHLLNRYLDSLMLYNIKSRNFSNANFRSTHVYFRDLYRFEEVEKIRKIELENAKRDYYYLGTGLVFTMLCAIFGVFYYQKAKKNQETVNQLLTKEFENSKNINKEKSKYFAILSHELRTPIYAITGLAKLLEQTENNTPENVSSIINSGNHLLHLVNNVLQHNKLEEAGEVKLDEEEYNLVENINGIVQTTSYLARQKSIAVEIITGMDKTQVVFGDKQKLAQILINLVTNAIRYSPDNSAITIRANLSSVDDDHYGLYHFSIQDQGAGISDSQLRDIFNYQETNHMTDMDETENLKGMGIGLYVVANYLVAMGSQIMVRSQKEIGSEFYFDLRLKRVAPVEQEKEPLEFSRKDYTILVVDDNSINLIVAKKNIQLLGLSCVTAKDTDPVVDIVAGNQIDLILMDLNMPVINGFDLSKKIRKSGFSKPIIAHTAVLREHIDSEALEAADMQDFILKPYETEELKEKLVYYLEIYSRKIVV